MDQILDEPEKKIKPKSTFSKLALGVSIISILLIGYLFFLLPDTLIAGETLPVPNYSLIVMTYVSIFLGLFLSIMSYVRKEPSGFIRAIGSIINVAVFLLIVSLIIFSRLV